MKSIKIKNKQFPCVRRWVEQAVYIEPKDRLPLLKSINEANVLDDHTFIKFTYESVDYLNEHCPIHFLQHWASETIKQA